MGISGLALVTTLSVAACSTGRALPPPAAGAPPASPARAALLAPGVLSSDRGEGWITFDPAGEWVVFDRHDPATWRRHTIHLARRRGDGWSAPAVAPFSGTHEDRGARFSPDGRFLVFSSNRPYPGKEPAGGHFDLWRVAWDGARWGEPEPLPGPVNSPRHDFHASVAADGTIYFARSDGKTSDLYRARPAGGGYAVEPLGPPVNSGREETDVYVDPAQRVIVFARTDDPAGLGGDDLWVSFRTPTGWSEPRNLGPRVNSPGYEYGPWISRAEGALYFRSDRDGNGDLMRIPLDGLPGLSGEDRPR